MRTFAARPSKPAVPASAPSRPPPKDLAKAAPPVAEERLAAFAQRKLEAIVRSTGAEPGRVRPSPRRTPVPVLRAPAPTLQRTALDPLERDEVAGLYGIADPAQVPPNVHQEHLPTLRAFAVHLAGAVNGNRLRLQTLALALAAPNQLVIGQAAMDERAQALVDYNALSGQPAGVVLPGVQPAVAAACLAAIRLLPNAAALQPLLVHPGGLNKLIAVHALSPLHLPTFVTLMAGGANPTALVAFTLSDPSMDRLTDVVALLPPGTANAALAWGPGAEADPNTNKQVHFEKHVLKINNIDNAEPWKWKAILGIDIQEADYIAWAGHSWTDDNALLFPNPTASITSEAQYRYFIENLVAVSGNAQAELRNRHQDAYTDLIEVESAGLSIVINDGGDVYKVLGNKTLSGHMVFIIAKLRDDGAAFEISSAYAPVNDKVAANQVKRIYRLA